MDFKSEMRGLLSVLSAKSALIMANPMYKEKGQHCNRQIEKTLSSLLALIEKKFPKERSHKDSCDYEAWSCTCGATEYNEAISEIRSQFK